MAVIKSKGDGYSLYGGTKLLNIPEYDKTKYSGGIFCWDNNQYFLIIQEKDYGFWRYDGIWDFCGSDYAANYPTIAYYCSAYDATEWIESPNVDNLLSVFEQGEEITPIWSDCRASEGWSDGDTDEVIVPRSEPIPLDGYDLIEWDGDTNGSWDTDGLWNNGDGTFVISDYVDVNNAFAVYNNKVCTEFNNDDMWEIYDDEIGQIVYGDSAWGDNGCVAFRWDDDEHYTTLLAYIPVPPKTITITYHSEHGIIPEPKEVELEGVGEYYINEYDLPTLTADGYIFKGWSTWENGDVITGEMVAVDTDLYAVWEKANKVTITYQSEHGTAPQPKTVEFNDSRIWKWNDGYGWQFNTPNPRIYSSGINGFITGELSEWHVDVPILFLENCNTQRICIVVFNLDEVGKKEEHLIRIFDSGDGTYKIYTTNNDGLTWFNSKMIDPEEIDNFSITDDDEYKNQYTLEEVINFSPSIKCSHPVNGNEYLYLDCDYDSDNTFMRSGIAVKENCGNTDWRLLWVSDYFRRLWTNRFEGETLCTPEKLENNCYFFNKELFGYDDLPTLTADGYIFKGWYLNDEKVEYNTPIDTDVTLYAMWEEQPSNPHIVESKGDGYALYNGVKLPNIDSIWDKEKYPYAYITSADGMTGITLLSVPLVYISESDKTTNSDACIASIYYLVDDIWQVQYETTEIPYNMFKVNTSGMFWGSNDVLVDDGSVYLSIASEPIPLDGMNVIEWDGNTEGLETDENYSNYYIVSDSVQIDTSEDYIENIAVTSKGKVNNNDLLLEGGFYKSISAIYNNGYIALFKGTSVYCALFAYYPVEESTGSTDVIFNNKTYTISGEIISAATADLKTHLSSVMNGTGATITLDGVTYNIDSTKLANVRSELISYITNLIAGSGTEVTINNTKYGIDVSKLNESIVELQSFLQELDN